MADIKHRTIKTNGINMHIAEAGQGPLVLLVHGFPELWYSWRHQLPALADAGFHAVAMDVRGYGGTDAPKAIAAYSMNEIAGDMAGLMDELGEREAVIAGHDWGAGIAWALVQMQPDRYRAAITMSVPFTPRAPMKPTDMMRAVFQGQFFYILYFQEPGVAEAELDADPDRTMRMVLYAGSGDFNPGEQSLAAMGDATAFLRDIPMPETLPAWLKEEDIAYFASEFRRTGFRGGLNRYRNLDRDWQEIPELGTKPIEKPVLFIYGDKDAVMSFAPMDPMKQMVPNLKVVSLPGAGHWTQQERPAEVNAAMIEFLKGLPS